jgi:4-amino-4-deoxy-L-arabinose transferase-like glycosyltransferase
MLYCLLLLTALRLVLCAAVPLAPDEAYYYAWSAHLQGGYFDHPPMVALMIRAGTWVAGPTPLGIRFMGPVLAAAGTALVWDAGEQLFPQRQTGLYAALFLNATLMVGAGAIIMTPDTPLLFFWAAGIAALGRLVRTGDARWWLAVGVACGGMLLSKYTSILFIAAVFLWAITRPAGRAWLRTPWPWAGLALALAIFSPNIAWNAAHGWVSYLKQGSRTTGFDAGRSLQFLGEFAVAQIALATPVIFALCGWGLWRLRAGLSFRSGPGAALVIWLTAVPVAVFVEHCLSGRVEGNWAAIAYPSACIAAACLPAAVLRRWAQPAVAVGLVLTGVAYAQALGAPLPVPAKYDPTALQLSGWPALAGAAAALGPAFITSDDYATTAELAYEAPKSIPVVGFARRFDPRWKYFALPPANVKGKPGILLTRRLDAVCPLVLGTVQRARAGSVIDTYRLCRFVPETAGVLLPRP